MRGEFKVPGGKLVAVEFELEPVDGAAGAVAAAVGAGGGVADDAGARLGASGRLRGARLSGDFFAEPESAVGRIESALEGAGAGETTGELAARIEAGLAPGDALIGFDARAVAVAVRRALGRSTTWADHQFELIVDGPQSPAMHMALDQVYAEALAAGRRGPTLRIWEWGSNAVIIGSFQSLRNEVDLEAAARHDVTVVRRISGGGAMFVEPGNTITYSVVVPGSLVDGMSFEDSYAFLDSWVLGALAELGIAATYAPINDITSPAGKIAGAAQRRLADGTVLHHVTMAYDIDAAKMLQVLRIGREKLSDKGTASAAKRVDPLRSQTGMSREAVVAAFVDHFGRTHRLTRSAPRPEELAAAEELVRAKFGAESWTARVP
ncbi:MAG: lipoate--protein ligase family protein [Bifidobacteriaceae bacterium]|jgi:lipoate-protein ligase A|nr:lipoate--protein ligase family protein [Bifidobacteriaceae bacterium]